MTPKKSKTPKRKDRKSPPKKPEDSPSPPPSGGGTPHWKKIGRPTTLNEAVIDRVCSAVSAGNYLHISANYAGVSKSRFYDWCKRGRKDIEDGEESIYRQFVEALDIALAFNEARLVTLIAKAGKEQWQAAAWLLERRDPRRWGRRDPDQSIDEMTTGDELLEYSAWQEKFKDEA